MGCNYYAFPKATQELKDKIIESVNHGDFEMAKSLMPDQIHIGKSSFGWKFLFNHNDWQYFGKSIESLQIFLMACNIVDEYNRQISIDEFWEMVEEKSTGLDNRTYYKNNPTHSHNDNYHQEDHFGLFFSDSTNFS